MTNGKSKVLEISRAEHQLSYKQQFHKIIKIATIMGEVVHFMPVAVTNLGVVRSVVDLGVGEHSNPDRARRQRDVPPPAGAGCAQPADGQLAGDNILTSDLVSAARECWCSAPAGGWSSR